jgi:phosphoglycerate dehydrogenase-like enzyme
VRRAVIDLSAHRPVWRIPEASVQEIVRAFGPDWDVAYVAHGADSDGDGGQRSAGGVTSACAEAEVYIGWGVPKPVAEAARRLRWAHTAAAGVGGSITEAFLATGAVLTNSRGVHADPMADWAAAAIALCLRGFHLAVSAQRARRWAKDDFTGGTHRLIELRDARIGLVGLGGIGRAVARRCRALGMEVRGIRRRPSGRRPAGVSRVGGPADLIDLARWSDVLVICAPHTAETRGMIEATVLGALPDGAYLVNLARGELLDERALLDQLERGRLGGCVLDVLDSEPPPADHPFWDHPRVVFTPHVSAVSERFWERETQLIEENVRRYRAGRRLKNRVNLEVGY